MATQRDLWDGDAPLSEHLATAADELDRLAGRLDAWTAKRGPRPGTPEHGALSSASFSARRLARQARNLRHITR